LRGVGSWGTRVVVSVGARRLPASVTAAVDGGGGSGVPHARSCWCRFGAGSAAHVVAFSRTRCTVDASYFASLPVASSFAVGLLISGSQVRSLLQTGPGFGFSFSTAIYWYTPPPGAAFSGSGRFQCARASAMPTARRCSTVVRAHRCRTTQHMSARHRRHRSVQAEVGSRAEDAGAGALISR
jgi:hypothetical protein